MDANNLTCSCMYALAQDGAVQLWAALMAHSFIQSVAVFLDIERIGTARATVISLQTKRMIITMKLLAFISKYRNNSALEYTLFELEKLAPAKCFNYVELNCSATHECMLHLPEIK